MVVLKRNDASRYLILTVASAVMALGGSIWLWVAPPAAAGLPQFLLIVARLALVLVFLLALVQFVGRPRRSQIVLIEQGNGSLVIATNAIHEGHKLRFLRDILTESVAAFSDEDRQRWSKLPSEGFHPAIFVKTPHLARILPLCAMTYDDVFVVGPNRWDYYDCANTSEPAFAEKKAPPFKSWAKVGN